MACCRSVQLLRFWLLVQNLALFACALTLLTVSVDALVDDHPRVAPLLGVSVTARGTALLLVSAATMVLLLSFLGCCGAMLKSRCMLGLFGCFSVLMLVLTLAGFVAALVASGPGAATVERCMLQSMARYGNNDTDDIAAWDFLQDDFHCCGVHNGSDWATNSTISTEVPQSCCRTSQNGTYLLCENAPSANNSYFDNGCFSSAQQMIGDHTTALAGATAAVALFLILSTTLTCLYFKRQRQASYERLTV